MIINSCFLAKTLTSYQLHAKSLTKIESANFIIIIIMVIVLFHLNNQIHVWVNQSSSHQ